MIIAYYIAMSIFAFLEATFPSVLWPFLAFVSYLWFLGLMFRLYPRETLLISIMAITKVLILFSLIMIGLGFWITELQIVAQLPVYSCYFCILASIFTHAACQTSRILNIRIDARPAAISTPAMSLAQNAGAIGVAGFAIAMLFLTGMTKGFATLDGVDRFEFRAEAGWYFNFVVTAKYCIAAALGVGRFRIAKTALTKLLIDGVFAAFVLMLMLFGDKFLSLICLAIFYALPSALITTGNRKITIPRALVISVLTFVPLVLAATVWVYSDYGALNWDSTLDRLFGRSTGQGQVWYIVAHSSRPWFSVDTLALRNLTKSLGIAGESDPIRDNVGIFYIISLYAPTNVYQNIIANQGLVQFTGGFEAYITLLFGQIPCVIAVFLAGIIAGVACSYLYSALKMGAVVGAISSAYIYMTIYSMINQGSIWTVFGLRAIGYFLIFIAVARISEIFIFQRASVTKS